MTNNMSKLTTAVRQIKSDRGAFMASIIQHFFTWLPDELYLKLLFCFKMGYKLNLKNPKTFNEKLQWLKLYNRKPEYTTMVDKYAVKQYVANIIGEEYIIPTLGVWDRFDDIDFSKLPQQFVLKTTHGGGGSGVVICRDKNTFNKEDAKQKLEVSMRGDIYKSLREWPYKNVPKRIIAEKFMAPVKSAIPKDLLDYKFFCFNGEPKFCQVIAGRETDNTTIDWYDLEWNLQNFQEPKQYAHSEKVHEKPSKFDDMVRFAKQLSAGQPFLRVDFYCINTQVFFGELTFFPTSGFGHFEPEEMAVTIGNYLELE